MDIYSFLNSKDIAEHCRRLQKTWTPLQMALIISRSDRSVPDKHRAWRELISDYPDMPVPPVPACGITSGYESFHKVILTQINYEERVLRSFMEPSPSPCCGSEETPSWSVYEIVIVEGICVLPRPGGWLSRCRAYQGSFRKSSKSSFK